MTDAFIAVVFAGYDTTYKAACACGWTGDDAASIEFSELDLRIHYDLKHGMAGAA